MVSYILGTSMPFECRFLNLKGGLVVPTSQDLMRSMEKEIPSYDHICGTGNSQVIEEVWTLTLTIRNWIWTKNLGPVYYSISNPHFYILNNIIHISIDFFIYMYFKNLQTTFLKLIYQTPPVFYKSKGEGNWNQLSFFIKWN